MDELRRRFLPEAYEQSVGILADDRFGFGHLILLLVNWGWMGLRESAS